MKLRFAALLFGCAGCTEVGVRFDAPSPPPLSGGTLLVTRDGRAAFASDPDYDRLWIVDLQAHAVRRELELEPGSEPGRLVEDGAGRVHVALRRAGTLLTVDRTGNVIATRPVCGAPRGLDHDPALDALHIACAGGELVTVPAAGGPEIRRLHLDRDLRDVVVQPGEIAVSRFRSAERLSLDAGGAVSGRSKPPQFDGLGQFAPAVAWRMRALPGGGTVMVHQRALVGEIPVPLPPAQSYYGNALGGSGTIPDTAIVHTAVTVQRPEAERYPGVPTALVPLAGLPIDVAVSNEGARVAIASAAGAAVLEIDLAHYDWPENQAAITTHAIHRLPAQPVAVAYDPQNRLVVQTRRPARLFIIGDTSIALGQEPETYGAADAAHDLFHLPAGAVGAMSCASCHPEGGDDSHRWIFKEFGTRRTPQLRGGLSSTLPLHWAGDLADMGALVEEVYMRRMGGAEPGAGHVDALAGWLDALPALPPPSFVDAGAAERGRALFEDEVVACASCHAGPQLTDNKSVDVNTGGIFQVPSLRGVAHRAPFMHNGCAPTLHDRFGPCGGGDQHGRTSHLTPAQIDDLVAYLETL